MLFPTPEPASPVSPNYMQSSIRVRLLAANITSGVVDYEKVWPRPARCSRKGGCVCFSEAMLLRRASRKG